MHCTWLLLSLRPRGREEQSNWWEEEKQRGRTGLGQETPLSSRTWSCRGPEPGHSSQLIQTCCVHSKDTLHTALLERGFQVWLGVGRG